MKRIPFLLLLAFAFFACKTDNATEQTITSTETLTIEELEAALDKDNSEASAKSLVAAYNKAIADAPDNIEQNGRYSYRAASVYFRMNRFIAATQQLEKGIKNFYSASVTPQAADLLAGIYSDHINDKVTAVAVWQSMAVSFPDYENIAKIKEQIPADATPLVENLTAMGKEMFDNKTGRTDYKKGGKFINNCELFAALQPTSPDAASMLYRAAETAKSLKMYDKTVTLYDWIYTKYPNYEKYPQALFMYAFTLDSDMNKFEEARALYQEFIQKFPDNDFADDAQFLIDNLGKSEEEILKSFEQNNK